MAMDRDGAVAVLVPIAPSDLGLPEIADWENRTRTVRLRALDGKSALALFNGGEADLVLGGGIGDFPLTGSVGILRGTIQLDPVTGLFGLAVTHTDGFLSDPAQREALAMAIDRDGLITPFGLDGWRPTSRIVAPGLAGDGGTVGERWSEMPLDERRAAASARVSRWREARADTGDERAAAAVTLRIRLPSGPGGDILFTRLSADFAAIGISSVRARDGEAADLRLMEDVARYPRAEWFLNRFACAVNTGPCVRGADALVREAGAAADPAERAALLAEAEAELTRANIYIPFGPPVRWSLVRGSVDAFATNPWGWHPLMPLALRPR